MYAPHDLSAVEMAKWKSRGKPTHDVFDVLDFNPLEHYRVRTTLFSLPILLCLFAALYLIALDYELGPGKRIADYDVVEFLGLVRVHDTYGPDQAFQRDGSESR